MHLALLVERGNRFGTNRLTAGGRNLGVANRSIRGPKANQAGDRIAPALKEPRTAGDDLKRVQSILEPMRTPVPSWYEHSYLGFFDKDSFFKPFSSYSMLVEQVQVDPSGRPDFDAGGASH